MPAGALPTAVEPSDDDLWAISNNDAASTTSAVVRIASSSFVSMDIFPRNTRTHTTDAGSLTLQNNTGPSALEQLVARLQARDVKLDGFQNMLDECDEINTEVRSHKPTHNHAPHGTIDCLHLLT